MSCPEFIAQSFAVRTAAHLLHFSASTYAQHVALQTFYEGLIDLVDKYAEVYMGLYEQIKTFPSVAPPRMTPIPLLEDYLASIAAELEEDHESQALLNILAELEELTAQSLTRLRFYK
jgi:hypothetical protein